MDKNALLLKVRLGASPLHFFAEYPYFAWGEVDYDSDGDCERPTDRNWTSLLLTNRETRERLKILKASGSSRPAIFGVAGTNPESIRLAAYLTVLRTGGAIVEVEPEGEIYAADLDRVITVPAERLEDVERIRKMFLNPALAPLDSHAWWGGWKWCSDFCTDATSGLRMTMKAVEEGKASPEIIAWLRKWWDNPPQRHHREGVRHAIRVLTGHDPGA